MRFVLNLALLGFVSCSASPAQGQYDRDGRYVPSPNGVPFDPNARPIPMYQGTPGGAIGTPASPRSVVPTLPEMTPRGPDVPLNTGRSPQRFLKAPAGGEMRPRTPTRRVSE